MTIREWALLALAVIAGVPLYALVAGWTRRIYGPRLPWFCDCDACQEIKPWAWPIGLSLAAASLVLGAIIVRPARAAYRAALRGGDPKCPGTDCGGCQPWEPKP